MSVKEQLKEQIEEQIISILYDRNTIYNTGIIYYNLNEIYFTITIK